MECPTIATERWFRVTYKSDGNYCLPRWKKLLAFDRTDASKRFQRLYPLAVVVGIDLA